MSLLKLDGNGNLCEIGGLGDVNTPGFVEDSHLIFGHYKNEKELQKIRAEKEKKFNAELKRRKQAQAKYDQEMGEIRKQSLIAEQKAQAETRKQNIQRAELILSAALSPNVIGNSKSLVLNPLAGFGSHDVYINDKYLKNEGQTSQLGISDHFGRNMMLGNIFEDAFNVVTANIQTPVKIIVRTIQTGDIKEATKSSLTDFQRSLIALRTDVKPITDPALAVVGAAWESEIGVRTRKLVFNKYTDPGYAIGVERRLNEKIPIYGPIYTKIYSKCDEYTGNYLTRIELAAEVPGKLGRGEYVSKAELINAAIIALQVASIIASGGSAAVIISIMASQMKQGPLGQSKEGRTLLTLAEIAGYAYAGASSAGSAAAGGGAGAGASAAGTAVAERTTAEIVTRAVAQKAQQMAAEEAAKKVAKETNTGVLGQIAVQGALGPGSFQDATLAAGKQAAVQEAAKQLGPEATLIASAVVSASIKTESLGATLQTAPKVFAEQLLKDLEERARIEATHRFEQEVRKQLGEPAASIAIAAAKGESLENIAKKELTEQERKIIASQIKDNDKIIKQLNLQKQADLALIATSNPEQRIELINKAVATDQQIVTKIAEKNIALNQLGYSPVNKQTQLSENAATVKVGVLKESNGALTPTQKTKLVEDVKAQEAKKIEKYDLKRYDCAVNVSNYVGQLKMMVEQAAELRLAGKITEAEVIELAMQQLQKLIAQNEADMITYSQMVEVAKMQGAVRVAAAEEGRYDLAAEYQHPLLKYNLV